MALEFRTIVRTRQARFNAFGQMQSPGNHPTFQTVFQRYSRQFVEILCNRIEHIDDTLACRGAGIDLGDLTAVAFYDKPYIKFERLLETYHGFAPRGLRSFSSAIPVWIKEKLFMKKMLRDELARFGSTDGLNLLFPEHHLSHAASAFYPSPFKEAAILTLDGVGEWATTSIGHGRGSQITMLRQINFPHSLGLLYSAFTYYCGFRVNSGEYKLMGLAPYGNPRSARVQEWKQKIRDHLIDIRPDGSFLLNMAYFEFATGLRMCREHKWEQLFGIPRRQPESELTQPYMDMALAIQQVTEDLVLRLATEAHRLTRADYLVMDHFVFDKKDQPVLQNDDNWQDRYQLD